MAGFFFFLSGEDRAAVFASPSAARRPPPTTHAPTIPLPSPRTGNMVPPRPACGAATRSPRLTAGRRSGGGGGLPACGDDGAPTGGGGAPPPTAAGPASPPPGRRSIVRRARAWTVCVCAMRCGACSPLALGAATAASAFGRELGPLPVHARPPARPPAPLFLCRPPARRVRRPHTRRLDQGRPCTPARAHVHTHAPLHRPHHRATPSLPARAG
jgi:hypothetical protein